MNKQLFVHIGLPKTGSSAIQAWLARHSRKLNELGFSYKGFNEGAEDGSITSGNGPALTKTLIQGGDFRFGKDGAHPMHGLMEHYFGDAPRAIVSSETLSKLKPENIEHLSAWCASENIDLHVLAYVRHIYDHCFSAYQQYVKASGYTATFLEFSQTYENTQCRQIELWHSVLGKRLSVALYDEHKLNLVAHFSEWAQLPSFKAKPTASGSDRVNRSLSYPELELIRCLNFMNGGKLISELYRLIIQSDPLRRQDYFFFQEIHDQFGKRFSKDILEFNEHHFPGASSGLLLASELIQKAPEISQPLTPAIDPVIANAFRAIIELALEARNQAASSKVESLLQRARILRKEENLMKAGNILEQALKIEPSNIIALRQLAKLYSDTGREAMSRKIRKRIRASYPAS